MSPIAVVALLPVTLVMEPDVISLTLTLAKQHQYMWILLLVNSVMAYSANLLNFLVTKHTSALTLQVPKPNRILSSCSHPRDINVDLCFHN